ncbi:hypothetical protein HRG_006493 [Hirsutella rhossiliensis]|uniref:Uncharacterized protein n=1 Tax=Hirsutella rhossiliensis TaxID=111463 RepID=A0A9P8SIU9_9HYPO|nr:uncharacterized protein HRG_06493 [Hirsutella rhossiliensis]KAH0962391.1 hypothetical protein HRG_06493 [Hirsutella rhossiliensis]
MAACADSLCAVPNLSREEKREEFNHDAANVSGMRENLREDLMRIGHQYFDGAAEMREKLRNAWDELIHAAKILLRTAPSMTAS